MTYYADAWPIARIRHKCGLCCCTIMPGEPYWRQSGLDGDSAWTTKTCQHCERVIGEYLRDVGETEPLIDDAIYWLADFDAVTFSQLMAGWRYPDGGSVPLPYGQCCHECGVRAPYRHWWCRRCDAARIERIERQFNELLSAARQGADT